MRRTRWANPVNTSYPQCTFAWCPSSSPRTVTDGYTDGALTSIAGFTTGIGITYHQNGMVNQMAHANGVTDTQGADPNWMRRPGSLSSAYGATTRLVLRRLPSTTAPATWSRRERPGSSMTRCPGSRPAPSSPAPPAAAPRNSRPSPTTPTATSPTSPATPTRLRDAHQLVHQPAHRRDLRRRRQPDRLERRHLRLRRLQHDDPDAQRQRRLALHVHRRRRALLVVSGGWQWLALVRPRPRRQGPPPLRLQRLLDDAGRLHLSGRPALRRRRRHRHPPLPSRPPGQRAADHQLRELQSPTTSTTPSAKRPPPTTRTTSR